MNTEADEGTVESELAAAMGYKPQPETKTYVSKSGRITFRTAMSPPKGEGWTEKKFSDEGLADVNDYRRVNLQGVAKSLGGVLQLSESLGYTNSSFIVQMIGPNPTRFITEKSARKFEIKLNLPRGSLDVPIKNCDHVPIKDVEYAVKSKPTEPTEDSMLNQKQALYVADLMRDVQSLCVEAGVDVPLPKFITLVQQALLLASATDPEGKITLSRLEPLIALLKP